MLEYYHPKKFTLLGEIPIDSHCVIERGEGAGKDGKTMQTLNVTCTQQGRTYYMLTEDQEARDTWYKYICEDAGVSGIDDDSDHEDEIAGGGSDDDHPEEIEEDEEGVPPADASEKPSEDAPAPEPAPAPAEEEEDDDDLE